MYTLASASPSVASGGAGAAAMGAGSDRVPGSDDSVRVTAQTAATTASPVAAKAAHFQLLLLTIAGGGGGMSMVPVFARNEDTVTGTPPAVGKTRGAVTSLALVRVAKSGNSSRIQAASDRGVDRCSFLTANTSSRSRNSRAEGQRLSTFRSIADRTIFSSVGG